MIRAYRADDLNSVLGVWLRSARDAYAFLEESFFECERFELERTWMPVAETWIYEADGRVVGFIALIEQELGGSFVDPEMQGRGIGRALVGHARRLKGALELSVFAENARGLRFYERDGFEVVGEQIEERTRRTELRLRLPAD